MDGFGEALRRIRRRAGLSLDTRETRVNFSKSYISKVENGHRPGSREFAERCDAVLAAGGDLIDAYEQDALARCSDGSRSSVA